MENHYKLKAVVLVCTVSWFQRTVHQTGYIALKRSACAAGLNPAHFHAANTLGFLRVMALEMVQLFPRLRQRCSVLPGEEHVL